MNREAVEAVDTATALLIWVMPVQRGTFRSRVEAADIIVTSAIYIYPANAVSSHCQKSTSRLFNNCNEPQYAEQLLGRR